MVSVIRRLERGYVRDVPGACLHLSRSLGPADESPQHLGEYEPKCGWCWLNASHTEAAHAEAVGHGVDL